MKFEIKSRWSAKVIFECEAESIKECVEKAVAQGVILYNADLRGADLRGAGLRGPYLHYTDLRDADLRDADLRNAINRHSALQKQHGSTVTREAVLRPLQTFTSTPREAVLCMEER